MVQVEMRHEQLKATKGLALLKEHGVGVEMRRHERPLPP
jgi:hypothetical protein